MQEFKYKDEIIGFKLTVVKPGSQGVTDGNQPLQLVSLKHPKGAILKSHYHQPKTRTTERLQECIIVKKGKLRLHLFGNDQILFEKVDLEPGDLFFSLSGGIGIEVLEDAEAFELKNGPFVEDKVLIQ